MDVGQRYSSGQPGGAARGAFSYDGRLKGLADLAALRSGGSPDNEHQHQDAEEGELTSELGQLAAGCCQDERRSQEPTPQSEAAPGCHLPPSACGAGQFGSRTEVTT